MRRGSNSVTIILVTFIFSLTSCSLPYIMGVTIGQSKLLLSRQPIDSVLSNATVPKSYKDSLRLVQQATAFAKTRGLKCGRSFKTYVELKGEALTWVVAAVPAFSLQPKEWWFPIVGTVPYKGFFTKAAAEEEAKNLAFDKYETVVRPVTAFSTLGWFDDPVLTPLLKGSPLSIVNTIIHECIHQTVWVPASVSFNESLAHFVALQETINFFNSPYCAFRFSSANSCQQEVVQATKFKEEEHLSAKRLIALESSLLKLFSSQPLLPVHLLSAQKALLYELHLGKIKDAVALNANNAALQQELIYHRFFECFEGIVNQNSADLSIELQSTIKCSDTRTHRNTV
jgi:hypothetical protein